MIELEGETTEQKEEVIDRTKYIGGSDIAAVMGLSRWSTPLKIWAIKTKKIQPPDLSDVERVQIGIDMEENVARWFSKQTGYKVRRDNRSFTHPLYPYMQGHIDRWIVGEDCLLECKTTSEFNEKEWMEENDIPIEYTMQVMWYLGLVGKKYGHIACQIGNKRRVKKIIEFSQELFDKMVEAAKTFWEDFVECDIAPMAMADDSETLKFLFPSAKEGVVAELTQEDAVKLDMLIEERAGGVEQLEEVQKEVDRLSNSIKQVLGEAEAATTDAYTVTWKNQTRTSADTVKMKAAGIFDEYSVTSEFRVLRTKKNKPAKGKK